MTNNLLQRIQAVVCKRSRPVRDPDVEEALASFRAKDHQNNVETSPPTDENIALRCVWGVEFYTPSHIEGLIDSFRRLNWEPGDYPDPSRNPEVWLRGLRGSQYGGAWLSLGSLVPEGSKIPFLVDKHTVPLPEGVEYALASISSVSPSLVSIVVCFVLKDDTSSLFEDALLKDRETYPTSFITPFTRGRRFHEPWSQKRDHIDRIRAEMSKKVGGWFSENLPGLFSTGLLDGKMPTCEFVTLREAEPFSSLATGSARFYEYLNLLGMGRDFDVWKSIKTAELKFRMPSSSERDLLYHSMLAAGGRQSKGEASDLYDKTSGEPRLASLDLAMSDLLRLWAILPLLEGYRQHLERVRKSFIPSRERRRDSADVLELLGSNVAYSVDIAAVASELDMLLTKGFLLLGNVKAFEPCDTNVYQAGLSLEKHLKRNIKEQVKWLQKTDESVRGHLSQYGSLLAATESVRLQSTISRLTWALFLIGGGTLVVALVALFRSFPPSVQPSP